MSNFNYEQVEQNIKNHLPDYLSELGIRNLKKNFTCLNPTHPDNDPSMTYYSDSQTVYCHGCGTTWNIFQLYAVKHDNAPVDGLHVSFNFKQVRSELAQKYGENIPHYHLTAEDKLKQKVQKAASYTIRVAQRNLNDTDYLQKRGISNELAQKFHLGYVSKWKHPNASFEGKDTTPTPRLIIPTSSSTYLARDVRSGLTGKDAQYKKMKVGSVQIFNRQALYSDEKPIFLVEGEIDALSIMQASDKVEAVALGSTSEARNFKQVILQVIREKKITQQQRLKQQGINERLSDIQISYDPTFLLAMDNDPAGDQANHILDRVLTNLHFDNHYIVTSKLVSGYDDANEVLVKNKQRFQQNIEAILQNPDQYLSNLLNEITERSNNPQYIPTGFDNLDKLLDHGLYPQLYVIGAVSSLGKTTFVLQIADNIARQHRPVFFFSLETSRATLTEKIISRMTFDGAANDPRLPQSARAIDNGYFCQTDEHGNIKDQAVYSLVTKSFDALNEYYKYLMINNGITNRPSAVDVCNEVERYCLKHPNSRPVVIVDYLQILKPVDDNLTDKEAVTRSIAKLNELTEKCKAPVILISSFNRASYKTPAAMTSFKESGEIEYYSDVLIGLNYPDGEEPDFTDTDPRRPRSIEARILKNRNGVSRSKCRFTFYNAFNKFIPEKKWSGK